MPRGGKREGAGRKPGSANIKTREIADRALSEGVTPLEVILEVMRKAHAAGDFDKAVACAAQAAPYVHPRLSAIDAKARGSVTIELLSFAQSQEQSEALLANSTT